jgi:putative hydrolase of the HAD superfamily
MTEITAIGFDIDGTLYPPFALYGRLIPFTAFNLPLMTAFQKTRKVLHAEAAAAMDFGLDYPIKVSKEGGFYKKQAALLAKFQKKFKYSAKDDIEMLIYEDWTWLFRKIKPYPHVFETITALKYSGYKLGILSDFPVREKLIHMGLGAFWDASLSSEEVGALKPHPIGFLALAEALGTPPEKILYVGNSYQFDVCGAAAAGMKTALRVNPLQRRKRFSPVQPDLLFSDYRELAAALGSSCPG